MSADYGSCFIKQIVNDRTDWSDQTHSRAWQLTVQQLSPSSKTLTTLYHTLLTSWVHTGRSETKQTRSHYVHSLPTMCHDFVWWKEPATDLILLYIPFQRRLMPRHSACVRNVCIWTLRTTHTVESTDSDGWWEQILFCFFQKQQTQDLASIVGQTVECVRKFQKYIEAGEQQESVCFASTWPDPSWLI